MLGQQATLSAKPDNSPSSGAGSTSRFFDHPMHLHGAYFRVRSEGDGKVDVALPVEKQRLAVTERIEIGGARSVDLLLEREGRWLFHCHLLLHMSAEYRQMEPYTPGSGTWLPAVGMHHAAPDPSGMSGMALGLTVLPGAKSASWDRTRQLPRWRARLGRPERPDGAADRARAVVCRAIHTALRTAPRSRSPCSQALLPCAGGPWRRMARTPRRRR